MPVQSAGLCGWINSLSGILSMPPLGSKDVCLTVRVVIKMCVQVSEYTRERG